MYLVVNWHRGLYMLLAFSALKYPCVPGSELASRSVHAVGFQYLEVPMLLYSPHFVEADRMGMYPGANWYQGLYILLDFNTLKYPC